jgi:hypothetical protein
MSDKRLVLGLLAAAAVAGGTPLPNVGPTKPWSTGTCEYGGKLRVSQDKQKAYCTTCGRMFERWGEVTDV